MRRGPTPIPPTQRFWAKVEVADDPTQCWLWRGGLYRNGYGRFAWSSGHALLAHRYAYELMVAPIPEGLEIDHLCGARNCVNPKHLEAVPHRENLLRGNTITARHAAKTHCPQGHAYDRVNTHWTLAGTRKCRACNRARKRIRGAS